MKITHLSLNGADRQLAAMRAAMAKLSLTDYIARLVRADAKQAGLADFMAKLPESGSAPDDGSTR